MNAVVQVLSVPGLKAKTSVDPVQRPPSLSGSESHAVADAIDALRCVAYSSRWDCCLVASSQAQPSPSWARK